MALWKHKDLPRHSSLARRPSTMESINASLEQPKTVWAVIAVILVAGIYHLLQIGRRDPRMPPGPPTLPILGNFHQIPSSGLYAKYVAYVIDTNVLSFNEAIDFANGLRNMALFTLSNSARATLLYSVTEKPSTLS